MQYPDIVTLSPCGIFVFSIEIWYNNIGELLKMSVYPLWAALKAVAQWYHNIGEARLWPRNLFFWMVTA